MKKIISLIIISLPSILFALSIYKDQNINISINKPDSWHYISISEFLKSVEKLKHNNSNSFKEFKKDFSPIFAISKFKEPYENINPWIMIQIQNNINPDISLNQLLDLSITDWFNPFLTDYKILKNKIRTKVNNYDAIYFLIDSHQILNNNTYILYNEVWFIKYKDYIIQIEAQTAKDEISGKRNEIKSIIETISIN